MSAFGTAFAAVLLLVAVLASGSASARGSSDPRAVLKEHIHQAQDEESKASYPLIDFEYAGKGFHGKPNTITEAKQHLIKALGLISDAKHDAHQYEADVLALPVADRPAGAISGVHEIQNLLERAARYDAAAQSVFDKLDAAYLSYEANGSAARLEQFRRDAAVIRGDLGTARERKDAAREAAKKLPALPAAHVQCVLEGGLSGTGPGYPDAQGDFTERCSSPIDFDTIILSSTGHSFSSAHYDSLDNTFTSCTAGNAVTCKFTQSYQKNGGPLSFGWHFAAGDSAQSGGSCGLTYEIRYTLAGKTVYLTHETAPANGAQNCTEPCPPGGCGFARDDSRGEPDSAMLARRRRG